MPEPDLHSTRLIVITDPRYTPATINQRLSVLLFRAAPGTIAVQLRDREKTAREFVAWGRELAAMCAELRAPLLINDRLDVALALGVGAHLGGGSVSIEEARRLLGAASLLSVAAHHPEEVRRAEEQGASAALLSPIFVTPGKGVPLGLASLRTAREASPTFPIFGLGGVSSEEARGCLAAGATGIAAIRSALSRDPGPLLRALGICER